MAQRAGKSAPKTKSAKGGRRRRTGAPATLRQQDLLDRATRHIRLGSGSRRSGRSS